MGFRNQFVIVCDVEEKQTILEVHEQLLAILGIVYWLLCFAIRVDKNYSSWKERR